MDKKTIDDEVVIPPPSGSDPSTVTRDLETALDRACKRLVERIVLIHRVSRRKAYTIAASKIDDVEV